jgi:hypothetical protein
METVKVRLKKGSSFWDPTNQVERMVTSNKDFVEVEKTSLVLMSLSSGGLEEYSEDKHKEVKETPKEKEEKPTKK